MREKKVFILYTGGTIGMKPDTEGFTPQSGFLAEAMSKFPELDLPGMPDVEIAEIADPIDSSNMSPEHWTMIAKQLASRYDEFDGFVVLHGTDTMAYTASALSFMLENLAKPVIVTGSQIPLIQLRTDARDNLVNAIFMAGNYAIPEVCLLFHDYLYRGNRSTKIDADGFAAFASPNFPPLAKIGSSIRVKERLLQRAGTEPLSVRPVERPRIGILTIFPGISAQLVGEYLQQPFQGLIIQTYGTGNAPVANHGLVKALGEACERGLVVVNCSQCLHGQVIMSQYATGNPLLDAGVTSGGDMTTEAALAKLDYLLSQPLSVHQVREQMETDLRGELTVTRR